MDQTVQDQKMSKQEIKEKFENSINSIIGEFAISPSKKTRLLVSKLSKKISRQVKHEIADKIKKEKKEAKLLLKKKRKPVKVVKRKKNS